MTATVLQPVGQKSAKEPRGSVRRGGLTPWAFLGPALILIVALRVFPMLLALGMSFTDVQLSSSAETQFIGTENYEAILNSAEFGESILVTLKIVVPALVLEMVLGLLIALWLNKPVGSRKVARGVMLVPYLLVPVVIGNIFRMIYSAQFGQLNYMLGLLGMDPQAWLTNPKLVQWSVVFMEVWHTTPFVALMCLAGLAGISKDTIEAAMVDGAGTFQRFYYVVLPSLLPILGAVFVLRGMDALQLFDEVFVLTGGGPGRLTSVLNLFLYQFGFRQFRLGETSAAVTLVVLTFAVVAICVQVIRAALKKGAHQ
ncbi:sugar ABC transporter permease [Actinomycetaceae bacterium MB13-C1-2]|nr:sugar ABC transporter permease [Actinomycetaceae bacterium MB13-C1-2]